MDGRDDYLIIGKVTRPTGLKGAVRVAPITDDPARYHDLDTVYLENGGRHRKAGVEQAKVAGRYVIVKLDICESVEDAERLRGELLYVKRSGAVRLDKGSYYYIDILGCTVKTTEGTVIGKVTDIYNAGSCDVYTVRSEGKNGMEYLIPAVKEVVKEIVVEEKQIVIEEVEGLF